jgi:prolyl 4-hydroxylase
MNFISKYEISPDLCDRIIEYFMNSNLKFRGETLSGYDPTRKISTESVLLGDLHTEYMAELERCVNAYKQEYVWCDNEMDRWGVNSDVKIQMYPPGGGYFIWHAERCNALGNIGRRFLVFMTYLNDVDDGGETEFYYQKVKFKPKKGLTLIWPADWTHTHRGIVSNSKTKFIVTGWFEFDPPCQLLIRGS